jgi:hypothetical protein
MALPCLGAENPCLGAEKMSMKIEAIARPFVLVASWLCFAPSTPALAQGACGAPPDFAAKCCPPQALSLVVAQPSDLR